MTHYSSFSVSCLFFIYRQYTQLHHAFFCNPIWYVLRHWSAGSGPFRTRHGCETKLSSGETTVLALWGFRSSDGISTDIGTVNQQDRGMQKFHD